MRISRDSISRILLQLSSSQLTGQNFDLLSNICFWLSVYSAFVEYRSLMTTASSSMNMVLCYALHGLSLMWRALLQLCVMSRWKSFNALMIIDRHLAFIILRCSRFHRILFVCFSLAWLENIVCTIESFASLFLQYRQLVHLSCSRYDPAVISARTVSNSTRK